MEKQTAWVKRDGKWSKEVINKTTMRLSKKKKGGSPVKPKFPPVQIDRSKPLILAFTDGGCWPNGKPVNKAGYAFILVENDSILHEYSRGINNSTNNKCELQAIIDCLMYVQENIPDTQVLLHSDSQYCIHGICTWRHNWVKKGWKDVKNLDQWQLLSKLVDEVPNVQYKWIKAHGNGEGDSQWNNYVDSLCTEKMTGIREEDKSGRHK